MLKFISIEDCFFQIFPGIKRHLASKNNPVPNYEDEFNGLANLEARLEMVKSPHYKDFWQKAAYLFVSVTEGHFFSNGNKRLALSLLAKFYEINSFREKKFSHKKFSEKLKGLFPKYKLRKVPEIDRVIAEMFYHLAKIVADKNARGECSFDEVKNKIEDFLHFALVQKS